MSYLREALGPRKLASGYPVDDPRYWPPEDGGARSATGVYVNPEIAMTLRAVYRCVSLLSGVVGYLPLHIYRRLERGKERATNHPLYRLFQLGPNRWQTAEQWLRLVVAHIELRGNSYNQVIPGPRGIIDQLIPLHPARVTPEVNNNDGLGWVDARSCTLTAEGEMRYVVVNRNGQRKILTEAEVFHIRGLSSNGVLGLSRIALMRESVGLALATESYGARFFSQNSTPRGVFKGPGTLTQDAFERMKKQVDQDSAGLANAHRTKILENGFEWQAIGLSNEDSQFLETRKFQVGDIAGWFGVPPHLIGDVEKSTSWGSGLAEQNLALLAYTIAPILECIEQAIDKELIIADQTYYAEFLVDALLRTDPKAREEAINIQIMNGTLSPNEARELNNRNPRPGGDDFLVPLNMQVVGADTPLEKRVEAAQRLVQAGYTPEDACSASGLPNLAHLGLPPTTVQAPRDPAPPPDPPIAAAPPEESAVVPSVATLPPPADAAPAASASERGARVLRKAAAQVVRKEVMWVRTWASRCARNPALWREKVTAFYERHEELLVDRLDFTAEEAAAYCVEQRDTLILSGVADVETWESERVADLVAIAEGEAA